VILHHTTNGKVHGFTTAASIWVTAALGVLCGLAAWKLLVVAIAGVLFLLLTGGPIEKWCQKALGIVAKSDPPDSR
jgi:putative Mg2+ transporter-C (MgtC) family protein